MHQNNRSDVTDHIIEVLVIHGAGTEDLVDLILEGVEMLCECRNTANVFVLPTYALNLAYPTTLRYIFEVFQKLFLKLDRIKGSLPESAHSKD